MQILFPATGLLVFSAWCLGVLNSHHKFFVSYVAPVVWNAAMIATLVFFGTRTSQSGLVIALAWGTVVGCALQFGIQIPFVLKYAPRIRLSLQTSLPHVRDVIRSFGPVVVSRGVVQLSGVRRSDHRQLARHRGGGRPCRTRRRSTSCRSAFSGCRWRPRSCRRCRARSAPTDEINIALRKRLERGLRQIAFFVVPTVTAFIFIGRVLVAALYQSGEFRSDDTLLRLVHPGRLDRSACSP